MEFNARMTIEECRTEYEQKVAELRQQLISIDGQAALLLNRKETLLVELYRAEGALTALQQVASVAPENKGE